jgi:TPR repeat protein
LGCKLCAILTKWLLARTGSRCDELIEELDRWDRSCSNEDELWGRELYVNRELIDQAAAQSHPAAALILYRRAAEAGSVWAMEMAAWHYHVGSGVDADFTLACDYYRSAITAGSWMATLGYARLLASHGHFAECDRVLEDGIKAEFVPAYYWLARLRLARSKSRATCREIRPLLKYAAGNGHPEARRLLAVLMLFGRYGLRNVPKGWRALGKSFGDEKSDVPGEKSVEQQPRTSA